MASLYKTAAAVCLMALCGLRAEAAGQTTYKFRPLKVDDAAYFAANLVRNGKLPVHVSEVARDDNIVSTLNEKVVQDEIVKQTEEANEDTCEELIETLSLKEIFHLSFDYTDSPNYRELLQKALDAGLQVFNQISALHLCCVVLTCLSFFKRKEYPSQWGDIWEVEAGANLAYLLGSNSTKIGCVIGECVTVASGGEKALPSDETSTGKAALFCKLSPEVEKGSAPFDEEYFTGLVSRTAKLTEMAEEDLKAPSNDGTAAAALPTILAAILVAMLTALSA
ncbi:SAG family member [Eimeria brunetti]|uniref:SAG family member n=1 Tax=Eimeria brunetti TaxID=51314 RepID=U6LAQ1_9EIME|nr:SAG family member [Eimeria brunetti]